MKITTILFFLICTTINVQGQNAKTIKMNSFIDSLLNKMTLDEKVGQMNQYNGFWEITGPVPKDGDAKMKYEHLKNGLVGSVLNVKGVENVRKLQEIVVKETRLGIPLIFGYDVIHGHKTLAPIPLGEAASWDLVAIEKSARMAAVEASAVGINWTFAPMVDIGRDPRWGRVMEGAGEDPYLGAKIGVARVKGFQGNDLSANNTIAACAKHFAGYGFAEAGRDYNTVDVGTVTLYNTIFPPFKAVSDAGVKTFMNSFNVLNGVPATANTFLQRDILKSKWSFSGFIVSDWGSGIEMIAHGFAKDAKDVAMLAANSGSDMDMESMAYVKHLKQLVEENKVDLAVINDAVKRILTVKYELGLFDDPYRYCDAQREKDFVSNAQNNATVLDIAKKSIVLLKNDKANGKQNSMLPLSKNQKNIAIIGALANDKTSPLGSWRIGSDDETAVSVVEGIKKYTSNYNYLKGADLAVGKTEFISELKINETDKSGFAAAIALAKKSEVVIMVLGEHGFQSGEGRSRTNLNLPGVQQELLEAVYKVNKNIVLILMNGRPLTINWAANNIPSILETWHLGTQSGNAIAQVLFGDYNPSGKLPMTFPRSVGQIPIYYNYYNTGRPGPIDLVFWSHYNDEKNTPLYPFGFGLSYTNFEYSDLKIDNTNSLTIKVKATIKNTGKFAGEEVVQLYIRDKVASIVRPVKELKGFSKIKLMPNESQTVEFTLTKNELGFYNEQGEFIIESGEFDVMVGTNSQIGLKTSFALN
jgi:beta-glucosidase